MENKNKIVILCYLSSKVFVFNYDENIYDNAEDFFESELAKEYELQESNCQYMVVSYGLNIIIR